MTPTVIENLTIPHLLEDIEKEHDVKILLAVESGSRAWGFESKDSDWDVRFIYVHKPEWYFKIDQQRDVIEYNDGVNDLAGWELRKALSLLKKSNASLLEWINSPIIYYFDSEFKRRIEDAISYATRPERLMYHYNHIYNKQNARYNSEEGFTMKRFLYYLRGILACKWIHEKKRIPPVNFLTLVEATVPEYDIKMQIYRLVDLKKAGKEHNMLTIDNALLEYAKKYADYYNSILPKFMDPSPHTINNRLDALLFDMVNRNK